jgi:8-oxo-dGTP pyrophosphatase MutT (NUDIX family)
MEPQSDKIETPYDQNSYELKQNTLTSDLDLPIRRTARIFLFDGDKRILLLKFEDGGIVSELNSARKKSAFWTTPGGEVEEGETEIKALTRELSQELGLKLEDVRIKESPRALGEHVLNWKGVPTKLTEYFFVGDLINSKNLTTEGMTESERAAFRKYEWFSLENLRDSDQIFLPKDLTSIIEHILDANSDEQVLTIDMSTPPGLYT